MAFNPTLATFSFVIFVTGMILTYLTASQQAKLSDKCVSNSVQGGMNLLLMMSVMMMVIPIIQLSCHWGCGCPQPDILYKWILLILLCLMLLGSSIVLNGLKDDCDASSVKSYMIGLISTSVIMITGLIVVPLVVPGMQSWATGSDDYYYPTSSGNNPLSNSNDPIEMTPIPSDPSRENLWSV
jgi:cytochrome bd-type quinol oxidase subunit 2